MRVFIPTIGRATKGQQSTVSELTSWGISPTLLVDAGCAKEYELVVDRSTVSVVELPPSVRGTGHIRDYIIRELSGGEAVCMMDDDLTFFVRREDDRTKFRAGTPEAFREMLHLIEHALITTPHVGIASREGGQRNTESHVFNTRILRLLAYDPKVIIKEDLWFSQQGGGGPTFYTIEDFHMALSLLERGYKNMILNNYCHNQRGSGLVGGCSTYRTSEVQDAAARKLAELHPGFVKIVQKETKGAWGGGTRTDVQIQWKKAYSGTPR